MELVSVLIRPAGESTSALVNCQQRGGLLSVHGNILQIFNALELMFRQSTNSTITRQIDLQNLVQTAVNDASLVTLYNGCVNDVSVTTLRKDDMLAQIRKEINRMKLTSIIKTVIFYGKLKLVDVLRSLSFADDY